MSAQLELLEIPDFLRRDPDPKLRARRTDPASSHAAGEGVERSGIANDQRQVVLTLIKRHPGSTSKQLAAHATQEGIKLDRFQIARRCPELIERALVTDPKTDTRNKPHEELRWWPVAG